MGVLHQIGRVTKYMSNISGWLLQTRPLVWVLATIFVVLMLGFIFSPCFERHVRFSGMTLQLVGVMLIAVGLRDTRRAFEDQPTTWESVKTWWRGRPRFTPRHIKLEARGGAYAFGGASARMTVGASPDASLEHRLAALERQHAALFDEVGKLQEATNRQIGELTNAIAGERKEREKADTGIREQLKKAIVGGLPLGRVGAVCFFFGIIAATISPEIASWLGAATCQ